jgi:hypothetical protein
VRSIRQDERMTERRGAWIELANRVINGDRDDLRCPENDDDFMDVEWITVSNGQAGEYWIHCRSCRAETHVRVSR